MDILASRQLAEEIFRIAHVTGSFRLRSGAVSHEYFDKYRFASRPDLLRAVAEALRPLVPERIDAVAGLELGGVPIAVMLSQVTGLPTLFVRKKPKSHGTGRLTEGDDVTGRRILLVEDVLTNGSRLLRSAHELRRDGAIVEHVLCVIDRETGGAENLHREGMVVSSLFRGSDFPDTQPAE